MVPTELSTVPSNPHNYMTGMINVPFYRKGSVAGGLTSLTLAQTEIMGQDNGK